jgi:SAM-dependent methyltransferase
MSRNVDDHFGATAAKYTASASHASGADLSLLLLRLPLRSTDVVADIATGTGHTALAIAPHARRVVGVDRVSAMLSEARNLARARGIANVDWIRGDAVATGLTSALFNVVTCRRAAHHFSDVEEFLSEVRRLMRPGGFLGLVDQVPSEDRDAAELTEAIEKVHDPSHARGLRASEWQAAIRGAGFEVRFSRVLEDRVSLRQFVSTSKDADRTRIAIDERLAATPVEFLERIGFSREASGERSFIKMRLVVVAARS